MLRILFSLVLLSVTTSSLSANLTSQIQLGMNGVSVKDQGWEWGSCVTFAVTQALNAHKNLHGTDEISPTCFIQLTRSLSSKTESTWWDDGDGSFALLLMEHYGVWTLGQQQTISHNHQAACGGLQTYPFTEGQSNFIFSPPFDVPENYEKKCTINVSSTVAWARPWPSVSINNMRDILSLMMTGAWLI